MYQTLHKFNSAPFTRIWDVENKRKQKTVIAVKSKERGARTKITTCAYSHDGSFIAAGTRLSFLGLAAINSLSRF